MEDDDLDLVAEVKAAVGVPVALKLSPFYSSMSHFAVRAVQRGADGLVLFNRFYQPDVDVDTFDIVPRIDLSSSWELRLPLRWTAILRPVLPRPISLAVTSGVDTGRDVAKALLVGADVVMTTSSLLRHGPDHIRVLEADRVAWMAGHGFDSVDQLRGSMSVATAASPAAFERANYVRTLHSWGTPAGTPAR